MNNGYYQQQPQGYPGQQRPQQGYPATQPTKAYGQQQQQQQAYPGQQQAGYGQQQYGYSQQRSTFTSNNPFEEGPSGKCRGVAALLALSGGPIGLHYFYCGKTGAGILCLLTAGLCGIMAIIGIVQAVMLFSMRSNEFEDKWANSSSFMPFF